MDKTLLSTKLYVPAVSQNFVLRPRLTTILSNALAQGFTLVSAPAGYGKTTLVSSWLRETGVTAAWLSLEESDNDPVRFLQYLLTALQNIVPGVRIDLLELVEGIQPASLQALMNILVNEIAKSENQFVLVLDDFHLIQDQSILDIVAFLLDHLPAQQIHLVLISRTDPPLSLSRQRVRNQMVEIRADQLRFTPTEIAAFMEGVMGFGLTAEEISTMDARTEGWIAGLQLAALSMQGCKDIPGFIAAFSGSHHYVVDYLTDEVLKHLDEPTRLFLLRSSILSRMCAALCNCLVNVKSNNYPLDGQMMLENLEKMNLFIIPLDEERRWYRYHHLFADALNRRLEFQDPEILPDLYRCASDWYEKNGLIADAIQCALCAGNRERVANLIEQNGCYLLMSGEVLTLLKWMEAAEGYFQSHPLLVIQKGWALTLAGRMEPAEQAFQTAQRLVSTLEPTSEINSMVGSISAGQAFWADGQGNIPEAARLAQQALDLLPDTDPISVSMRSVATGTLARTRWMMGELDQARQIFDQAVEISKAANNYQLVINTNDEIAGILMEQGHLKQAGRLLSAILPTTVRADGQMLPRSAQVNLKLSKIYYEWNQLEQAAHFAHLSLKVSEQWGNFESQAVASVMLARMEQALGNLEKAQALMQTADELNRDNRFYPFTPIWIEAALDRFWLSQGNLERVSGRIKASGINPTDETTYINECQYLTLLRWMLACGDDAAAIDLAERMLQKAKDDHRAARVIELLILRSLAYHAKKDTNAAVNDMALAVSLAQPDGFKRVFLDEGELVLRLLYVVKSSQDLTGYAGELLEAFGSLPGSAPMQVQLLTEPLTPRELEVLKLIEAGYSNLQIADRLVISIPTVKRHISNIYAKLGVESRTRAVSLGKELRLL